MAYRPNMTKEEYAGTQENLIKLRTLLASKEWQDLIVVNLQRFIQNDTVSLLSVRKAEGAVPDDFLRGRLDAFRFLTNGLQEQAEAWEKQIMEQDEATAELTKGQPDGVGSPYSESTSEEESN